MLERFFFKKIELWLVALLLVLIGIGVVFFSSVVHIATKTHGKFGAVGDAALAVAQIPSDAKDVIAVLTEGNKPALRAMQQRFEGHSGFAYSYDAGSRPDMGYLLLARYDAEISRSVVELVDLNNQKILHRWLPDFDSIRAQTQIDSRLANVRAHEMADRVRMVHPLAFEDGSLIYADLVAPLVKLDACSNVAWLNNRMFHHAIEPAMDGGVWTALHYEPQHIKNITPDFQENGIIHVSQDNQIVFEKSLAEILLENDLGYFLFGHVSYTEDPMHLNDVQEATFDGPYWQKGDLFLSVRNVSTIMLYRPSENRIVWHKQWPWVKQHDVDILDDHRIAVFDNHMYKYPGRNAVPVSNDVKIYDFETDKVSSPWKAGMEKHELRTMSEGRSEVLNSDEVFVEETNYGRMLAMNTAGDIIWEYVNRASDGQVYLVNWSRMVRPELGAKIAAAVAKAGCS